MDALGGHGDLGTETELAAIGKARAGVPVDGCGVRIILVRISERFLGRTDGAQMSALIPNVHGSICEPSVHFVKL